MTRCFPEQCKLQIDLGLLPACADLEVPPAPSAHQTPTVLASTLMLVCNAQQTLQALQVQPLPVHVFARQALVVPLVLHALLEPSPLAVPQRPPMPLAPDVATLALDLPQTLPLQPLPTTHVFVRQGLEVQAAHLALPTPLAQEVALIHAWLALPALSAHQTLKVSQIVRHQYARLANSCLLVPTTPRSPASASLDSAQAVPPHPASSAPLAPFLLVAHTMPCGFGLTSAEGTTTRSGCVPSKFSCPVGMGAAPGAVSAAECACLPGFGVNGSGSGCALCPVGSWSAGLSATDICTPCPFGTSSPAGSSSSGACYATNSTVCPVGMWIPTNTTASSSAECVCKPGFGTGEEVGGRGACP
jgi:hypothetical protein